MTFINGPQKKRKPWTGQVSVDSDIVSFNSLTSKNRSTAAVQKKVGDLVPWWVYMLMKKMRVLHRMDTFR